MAVVSPVLWFDGRAEEAIAFYATILGGVTKRWLLNGEQVAGAELQIDHMSIAAINVPSSGLPLGGSLMVVAADQAELDRVWEALLRDGEAQSCGWLRDRYGVMWNVVPAEMDQLMNSPDRAAATRVTQAMLQMVKLDIAALRAAFKGDNA